MTTRNIFLNGLIILLLTLALLALPLHTSYAQTTCDDITPTEYTAGAIFNALYDQSEQGCLGGKNDTLPLPITAEILKLNAQSNANPEITINSITLALASLKNSMQHKANNSSGKLQGFYLAMDETIAISIEQLPLDIDNTIFGQLRWKIDNNHIPLSGNNPIFPQHYLEDFCLQKTATPACKTAYQEMQTVIRHANLVAYVLGERFSGDMVLAKKNVAAYAAQWKQYRQDTRTRFWWEMVANEAMFSKNPKDGYNSPPTGQLILLHPGVSLEYAPETANNVLPAITLEVLGYNHWGWKGVDGRGKMGTGIGGSVILNFSKRENYSTISYGGMVHFKHIYSVGVTRGKGPNDQNEWKVIIGLDVLKLFIKD